MRRFTWWDLHERAWRRAQLLFVGVGIVVAVYAAGILAVLGVSVAAIATGSLDEVGDWIADLGAVGAVAASLALVAVVVLAILGLGWCGLPRSVVRLTGAREPEPGEVDAIDATVQSFALAYGMPTPTLWVVDDPAPNALAFGRPVAGNVCVTTGALRLARAELDALCQFEVTALASRTYAYATAAADLVLVGEWCTRLLWSIAAFVCFTALVGVPLEIAAAYFVGTVVVVAVTRPLLLLAARALHSLFGEASVLVDLETMRHSALPASLACLLLHLVEDDREVCTRAEVTHLWFEPDVVEIEGSTSLVGLVGTLGGSLSGGALGIGARRAAGTRRALVERAATAIDQSGGDPALYARLDRAESASH